MSDYRGDPVYNDGQLIGWAVPSDDGAIVVHDGEHILAAIDSDGQPVDHSGYEVELGEPDQDTYVDTEAQQQAMLDARRQADVELLDQMQAIRAGEHDAEADHRQQNLNVDIEHQAKLLERALGRTPTGAEAARIIEIAQAQQARGDHPDLLEAAEQLDFEGRLHHTGDERGRRDLVSALIDEHDQGEQDADRAERIENGDVDWIDVGGRREDRAALIDAMADGRVDSGEVAAYDSREPIEPVDDWSE